MRDGAREEGLWGKMRFEDWSIPVPYSVVQSGSQSGKGPLERWEEYLGGDWGGQGCS